MNIDITTLSTTQLNEILKSKGAPKFRCKQLLLWLYRDGAISFDEMSNLPKSLREELSKEYFIPALKLIDKQESIDGTCKLLFELHDGNLIETVALPSKKGTSICCSSQSGCAMHCSFCATGQQGFHRNLTPGEIVGQILYIKKLGKEPSSVVVMGQGEPFQNYDNTLKAMRLINDSEYLNIGARHITISTCGILPRIKDFASEPEQFTLAVSLHSTDQQTRNQLMPGLQGHPLPKLRQALEYYIEKTNRRVSFEYAVIEGMNDSETHLKQLVKFCDGLLCHVNLIPLNEIEDSQYKPASDEIIKHWQRTLENSGTAATIRQSRGEDIAGACGQLSNRVQNPL